MAATGSLINMPGDHPDVASNVSPAAPISPDCATTVPGLEMTRAPVLAKTELACADNRLTNDVIEEGAVRASRLP